METLAMETKEEKTETRGYFYQKDINNSILSKTRVVGSSFGFWSYGKAKSAFL